MQNSTHDTAYYGLQHDTPIDHGTTHLSVLDKWGGAASITSTVNLIWGSHVMDNETGVIFNDEQGGCLCPVSEERVTRSLMEQTISPCPAQPMLSACGPARGTTLRQGRSKHPQFGCLKG